MTDLNQLANRVKTPGTAASGVIKTFDIQFFKEFRTLCEQNSCVKFGTNGMCPPAVASVKDVNEKVLRFSAGVVFQTVCTLEGSFDYKGMITAETVHSHTFRRIQNYIESDTRFTTFLALSAGAFNICKNCTYPDKIPCRYPDRSVSSIEVHYIDMYALLARCGIPYNNGPNAVFFV